MNHHHQAAEAIRAALDDPKRSHIGDPRKGVYKVSFTTNDMKEAAQIPKDLVAIGIVPTSKVEYDPQFGHAITVHVNIWPHDDQEQLLSLLGKHLVPERRQQLEDLVLARGPVPPEILARTWQAHQRGLSPATIAKKMNEQGIIPGMGKCWTAKKVREQLTEYRKQNTASAGSPVNAQRAYAGERES